MPVVPVTDDTPDDTPEDERFIRVSTDPLLDGSTAYAVTLDVGPDLSRTLSEPEAIRYARAVLHAAARADYDAAVIRQMLDTVQVPPGHVATLVAELRARRAPLDRAGLEPIELGAHVAAPRLLGDGARVEAFLTVYVNGKGIGQWTTDDARRHALYVLEALSVAQLDGEYVSLLMDRVDLPLGHAHVVVEGLAAHRDVS